MKNETKLVVRKPNHFVRHALNNFTKKQNQLMCILLGKYVHFRKGKCIDTTITVSELIKILGLSDGQDNYLSVKMSIDQLTQKNTFAIYDSENDEYIWRPFFSRIRLKNKTNIVEFRWNEEMRHDLETLKEKYTAYIASDYLKLSSIYSQNLYETLKSYENMPTRPQVTFTIADLHRIMRTEDVKSYQKWNTFNTVCINRAVKDINEKTDIIVETTIARDPQDKRKTLGLAFTIQSKDPQKAELNPFDKIVYEGLVFSMAEYTEIMNDELLRQKAFSLGKIKKENLQYYKNCVNKYGSNYETVKVFASRHIKDQKERIKDAENNANMPTWWQKAEQDRTKEKYSQNQDIQNEDDIDLSELLKSLNTD